MRKWPILIALILSLTLNVVFAVILLSQILIPIINSGEIFSGGGQYKEKNGLVARASSSKDLKSRNPEKVFYEFTVQTVSDDKSIAWVEFRNAKTHDCMVMRNYPQVVNWNEDGKEVRFVTPEIEVILKNLK